MGDATEPFHSPLVFGGHSFNPAWEPERFPTEDGFLRRQRDEGRFRSLGRFGSTPV